MRVSRSALPAELLGIRTTIKITSRRPNKRNQALRARFAENICVLRAAAIWCNSLQFRSTARDLIRVVPLINSLSWCRYSRWRMRRGVKSLRRLKSLETAWLKLISLLLVLKPPTCLTSLARRTVCCIRVGKRRACNNQVGSIVSTLTRKDTRQHRKSLTAPRNNLS